MNFKKIRSLRLPYDRQGYIWFCCRNFALLGREKQERIKALCLDIAGRDRYNELFDFLTGGGNIRYIMTKYYITNPGKLYKMRRQFYERYIDFVDKTVDN